MDSTMYKGFEIVIEPDYGPLDPREDENLGNMVCWHRRYRLGDDHPKERPDEYREMIKRTHGEIIELPLYLYDHSIQAIQTKPFIGWQHWEWDSGQIGFIWCSKEQIRKWFGVKKITKKILDRAINCLESEVQDYNRFIRGEAMHIAIKENDKCIDGTGNQYGTEEELMAEGQSMVDWILSQREKKWIDSQTF